ncbi:hypothetical protein C2G38_2255013 [Gigaspora rosea]|uniref:Uncharacterized protein n=1 Tax=Gigaspora rosea TaxID=44941 RepID=A0A397TZJ4_9GLOM|nr:hypothetical protein C2G38_2255013 [Gigaspora rosea]
MGGLGIEKLFYYGKDEFDGIEGFLYDLRVTLCQKSGTMQPNAGGFKIKGISNDERVELDDDLEVKIIELIQMKQREEESVKMYTYRFDICAKQTDIYETSHEAKIVEYEIEIMGELEKAKMDEVENSSDGLLDWLTIIDDGYLEKHVNGTYKVDQSSHYKIGVETDYDQKFVNKGFNIGMNMVENYYENEILVENIVFRMFINIRSAYMVNANGIINVENCYPHRIDNEKNTQIGLHNDQYGNIDHIGDNEHNANMGMFTTNNLGNHEMDNYG